MFGVVVDPSSGPLLLENALDFSWFDASSGEVRWFAHSNGKDDRPATPEAAYESYLAYRADRGDVLRSPGSVYSRRQIHAIKAGVNPDLSCIIHSPEALDALVAREKSVRGSTSLYAHAPSPPTIEALRSMVEDSPQIGPPQCGHYLAHAYHLARGTTGTSPREGAIRAVFATAVQSAEAHSPVHPHEASPSHGRQVR